MVLSRSFARVLAAEAEALGLDPDQAYHLARHPDTPQRLREVLANRIHPDNEADADEVFDAFVELLECEPTDLM